MTEEMPTSCRISFANDAAVMQRALQLALRGIGMAEPNPPVGAVIVTPDRQLIAEGFHERFGQAHAEINAIHQADSHTVGADLFVTLEPCSHFGKTPPCADAVIAAGFRRVVVGCLDPSEEVSGKGIQRLRDAGIPVDIGICAPECERLIAPFRMLRCQQRPWVHAKWAMTIDGHITASSGHSRWISGEESRRYVHELRGRMDAIITGAGTVRRDNPLLTARPPGIRRPIRVVLDSFGASITAGSKLLESLEDAPVLIAVTRQASQSVITRLRDRGAEVLITESNPDGTVALAGVLQELARRQCTHVMLESGSVLMGAFFDAELIDELHVFVAPKLTGGSAAFSPVGGHGLSVIPDASNLTNCHWRMSGEDLLFEADILRRAESHS